MKTLIFFMLSFSLNVLAVEPPGANEYSLGMNYSDKCTQTQIARATCLRFNQRPVSCRPGIKNERFGTTPAIVKCGETSGISEACRPFAGEFVEGQRCKMRQLETSSAFQARVACYAEDVKSATMAACPVGCEKFYTTLNNLHVCDWTTEEFNNYKECGLDLIAAITRPKICPNGRIGTDSNKGNAPRLNTTGSTVKGQDGQNLFNYYYKKFRLEISSTRGGKGTFCIYPKGQSCSKEQSYDSSNGGMVAQDITGLAPGTYVITATALENNMSSSLEVSVSDKFEGNNLCKTQSGTFCTANLKETEYTYLCGDFPAGEGWVEQGNGTYHRLTGKSCVAGQSTSRVSVTAISGNNQVYTGFWQPATGLEFAPKAAPGPNGPSFYSGKECSDFNKEVKDSSGGRWVCIKPATASNNTSSGQANYQATTVGTCEYWDFTSTDGSYTSHQLNEGARATRKLVSSDGKSLVSQTVTCIKGSLTDIALVSNNSTSAPAQTASSGKSCEYWNFTSTDGAYTSHQLNDGARVTRKLVSPDGGSLVNQNVVCKNGVLTDTSL